jgi:excisionase family DNA binding protein
VCDRHLRRIAVHWEESTPSSKFFGTIGDRVVEGSADCRRNAVGAVMRPVKKPEPLRTAKEAAEILNVSEKTVRRLIANGALPTVKIGALVRITPADLEDLIRDHRSR